MTTRKAILVTVTAWLVGVIAYGYWYVSSLLSQPDLYGYERWPIFSIFGFLIDRLIYLFFGLVVVLYAETVLIEMYSGKQRVA